MKSENALTINYTLDEKDFLTHQLYIASTSKRIKYRRFRTMVIWPVVFLAVGVFFLMEHRIMPAVVLAAIAIIWRLFFPLWERAYYEKHYKGFVRENYWQRYGKVMTLTIANDRIVAKENGIVSQIMTGELEEIIEVPDHLFLKINNGHFYIVPKDTLNDYSSVKARLMELADHLKIHYREDLQWSWR